MRGSTASHRYPTPCDPPSGGGSAGSNPAGGATLQAPFSGACSRFSTRSMITNSVAGTHRDQVCPRISCGSPARTAAVGTKEGTERRRRAYALRPVPHYPDHSVSPIQRHGLAASSVWRGLLWAPAASDKGMVRLQPTSLAVEVSGWSSSRAASARWDHWCGATAILVVVGTSGGAVVVGSRFRPRGGGPARRSRR